MGSIPDFGVLSFLLMSSCVIAAILPLAISFFPAEWTCSESALTEKLQASSGTGLILLSVDFLQYSGGRVCLDVKMYLQTGRGGG